MTGWTRAHWESLADFLLAGVRPYATTGHAFIHLPRGRPSRSGGRHDGLEGYARTLLLAAFRLRGSDGAAPGELADRYGTGLVAGVTPDGPEAWPRIDHRSPAAVEAGAIAVGLHETRPWIWEALSAAEREQVVDWLAGIHGKLMYPNNWALFPVIVNAFLKSVGAPYRPDEIERNLDRIDSLYRGGGWYVDRDRFDHYVGWAFHFYTLIWARIDGDESDPARAAMYRERLQAFLEDYRCLFGGNGAPLYHGRSLIYRWAALAPVWAAAVLGRSPLSPGETRALASRTVRYFVDAGAAAGGVLSMGWHREFLPMAQAYSGPASPYWASKGFLGLLAPPDHPVWTAVEEPLAVERASFTRAMPQPGFRAVGTSADGVVRVLTSPGEGLIPSGSAHGPHYDRLGYSTHTAPDLPVDGVSGIDMQAALERSRPRRLPRFRTGKRVEVSSVPWEGAEIRAHRVCARRNVVLRTAGYAIASGEPLGASSGHRWALARRRDGLTSAIVGLHGFDDASVREAFGANPFGRHSATPFLLARSLPPGSVQVALVVLTAASFDPEDVLALTAGLAERLPGEQSAAASAALAAELIAGQRRRRPPKP